MSGETTESRKTAHGHRLPDETREILPRCTLKDRREIEWQLKKLRRGAATGPRPDAQVEGTGGGFGRARGETDSVRHGGGH